jgi:hypothetical protein
VLRNSLRTAIRKENLYPCCVQTISHNGLQPAPSLTEFLTVLQGLKITLISAVQRCALKLLEKQVSKFLGKSEDIARYAAIFSTKRNTERTGFAFNVLRSLCNPASKLALRSLATSFRSPKNFNYVFR